jgi:hypothetical protein
MLVRNAKREVLRRLSLYPSELRAHQDAPRDHFPLKLLNAGEALFDNFARLLNNVTIFRMTYNRYYHLPDVNSQSGKITGSSPSSELNQKRGHQILFLPMTDRTV